MLRVRGIQAQQLVGKLSFFEQLAHGNDLTVVLLKGDGGVNPLAGLAHGAGDGQAVAAAHVLAINGDERIGCAMPRKNQTGKSRFSYILRFFRSG